MEEFDVVVVGGGIAGLTAAGFGARLGRSVLVLTGATAGGQLVSIDRIDGVPGFPSGVPGYELCPLSEEQATESGAQFRSTEARRLERLDGGWRVQSDDGELEARAVVLAMGSRFTALAVPGEERLRGHGVSNCASCDGPLLRDQAVAVVGGGDSALQEALTLAESVAQVIVLQRGAELTAQEAYRRDALEHPKITVHYGCAVEEIVGEHRVESVRVRGNAGDAVTDFQVGAVFPFVGLRPNTGLADQLPLGADGGIVVDHRMRTTLPGLLAAGTVRAESACQAVSCAADGATAAKVAVGYLQDGSWDVQPSTVSGARAAAPIGG